VVETLDHDAQYLKDGISNCLVLCHVLVLKQLVAVVGNQATSHKVSHVSCSAPATWKISSQQVKLTVTPHEMSSSVKSLAMVFISTVV